MLDRDVVSRWQLDGLKSDVKLLRDELRREREAAREELRREMEWARAERRRLEQRLDQLDRADGNHFLVHLALFLILGYATCVALAIAASHHLL